MMMQNAAKWLFAREQDARFTLHLARLSLLHNHSEMHPARAPIHAQRTVGEWAADSVASFAGSWAFVGLHVVWFTVWLWLHLDINLLTLIVSLEAIFLATFVLMSQNRGAAKDKVRDDVEAAEVDEMTEIDRRSLKILEQQTEMLAILLHGVPGQSDGSANGGAIPSSTAQASQVPQSPPTATATPQPSSDALSRPAGAFKAKNLPGGKANLRRRRV